MMHVKPHGMLYNQAATDPELSDAIARAVRDVDPSLKLVGLAGSELIRAGERLGLETRQEVFADRRYQSNGNLVPRSQPDAMIETDQLALDQTLSMILDKHVVSRDGINVPVQADTVCLHGDGEHALAFARSLRAAFAEKKITVSAE